MLRCNLFAWQKLADFFGTLEGMGREETYIDTEALDCAMKEQKQLKS